jgi:hypothetical protein
MKISIMAKQTMVTAPHSPVPPSPIYSGIAQKQRSTSTTAAPFANFITSLWQCMWHTLKGQFLLIAVFGLLLSIISAFTLSLLFQRAADDLNTIAYSSIPSVNSAQKFTQYIDDIDAKATDYLATGALKTPVACTIVGPNNQTTPTAQPQTIHDCDKLNIDAEIPLANHQLYLSANNVTFPGEETAVERITAGMEDYIALIRQSQYDYTLANGSNDPHNTHLQQAYIDYKQANQILSQHIQMGSQKNIETQVPTCHLTTGNLSPAQWTAAGISTNADCLSWINKSHVDAAYQDTLNFLGISIFIAIGLCTLFCALILFAVVRMAITTHCIINIGLSLSLLGGIIFSVSAISLLSSYAGDHGTFTHIVSDSYGSVYDAAILERTATNANADESRWLIAKEFNDPAAVTYWANDWQTNKDLVAHYIALAKQNQTYNEEKKPLSDMDSEWKAYTDIDTTIRTTANNTAQSDDILAAEKISTGPSNATFGNFTNAVITLSNVNNNYYQQFLNTMNGQLSILIQLSAIIYVVFGLLAVWGIAGRLKDF